MTLSELERLADVAAKHGWTVTKRDQPGAKRPWRWASCTRGGVEICFTSYLDGPDDSVLHHTLRRPSGWQEYVPESALQERLEEKP